MGDEADRLGDEVRTWIAEHWRPSRPLGEWWSELAEAGWAFPHHPVGYGGRGLDRSVSALVARELRAAGAFGPPKGIATMMVAPLLLEMGTPEQQRRWLPGIVTGVDVWCQLFSEPDAGSDLAALSTRALRDGDRWRVSGQKVWTSGAHYAQRAILLARTDPEAPQHRGISFFVIEMDQPAITTRPLVQLTGDAEFNEVFLDDAMVPVENLIGELNGGWSVAMRLLAHERASLDPEEKAGIQHRLDLDQPAGRYASGELADGTEGFMPSAGDAWQMLLELVGGPVDDPVRRQQLARIYSLVRIGAISAGRSAAAAAAGRPAGPEVSLGKLRSVELMRAWRELVLSLLGPAGQILDDSRPEHRRLVDIALSVSGMSIAGGTDEIQRNIVGERVLGLPAEPRP